MFYEPDSKYPDTKAQIGRWLGPADDVGNALTYKILKSNGWFVCRGTVRAWTPEEEANSVLLAKRKAFMDGIYDNMGRAAVPADFPDGDLTPEFPYYAEGNEDGLLAPLMRWSQYSSLLLRQGTIILELL